MKITLSQNALDKIRVYTKLADGEISGLMRVDKVGDDALVKDIILLEQECSGSETELDADALSDFLTKEIQANRDISDIKGWWHSHADMGVFWSDTDTETMSKLGCEWFVSIVSNKGGDMLGRLDIYKPFRVFMDKVDIEYEIPELTELEEKLQAEIDKKVKKPAATNYWRGYNRDKAGFRDVDGEEDCIDFEGKYPRKLFRKLICPAARCMGEKIISIHAGTKGFQCPECKDELVTEEEYYNERIYDEEE